MLRRREQKEKVEEEVSIINLVSFSQL